MEQGLVQGGLLGGGGGRVFQRRQIRCAHPPGVVRRSCLCTADRDAGIHLRDHDPARLQSAIQLLALWPAVMEAKIFPESRDADLRRSFDCARRSAAAGF